MTRVRLVVTGDVEEIALEPALRRLFPTLAWSTVKKSAGTWNDMPPPSGRPGKGFLPLVDEMLAAGDAAHTPGGAPFDYTVVVEDLEIDNPPEVAVAHVSLAVQTRLAALRGDVATYPKGKNRGWRYLNDDEGRRRYLRERCSYHLLSPMVESLFFGERHEGAWSALGRAGALRDPTFDPEATDIEAFETTDPAFRGFAGSAAWTHGKAAEEGWRARHPKHYVSFLCDPEGSKPRPYREKDHGRRALEQLDWRRVAEPPAHARLVRAMLTDLADIAGVDLPWLKSAMTHPATCLKDRGLLRNVAG